MYIGQSQNSLKERIKGHLIFSKNRKGSVFQEAIRKYGIDGFKWQVICICPDINSLNEREQFYIAFYDSMNCGYNRTTGGINCKMSNKTTEKRRNSNVGKYKRNNMIPIMVPVLLKINKKLLIFKQRTGNSMASLVRIAIDEYLQRNLPSFKFADKGKT